MSNTSLSSHLQRLQTLFEQGDYAGLERECAALIPQFPESHQLTEILAHTMFAQGKHHEALYFFKETVQRNPCYMEGYVQMGRVLSLLGKHDKAEICYKQALALDPNHAVALKGAANSSREGGQAVQAASYLDRWAAADPRNPAIAFEKANLCPLIWESAAEIDAWRAQYKQQIDTLPVLKLKEAMAVQVPPVSFKLVYHGRDNKALKQAYAGRFQTDAPQLQVRKSPPYKIGVVVDAERERIFTRVVGHIFSQWKDEALHIWLICTRAGKLRLQQYLPEFPADRYIVVDETPQAMVTQIREAAFDLVYFWEVGTTSTNYFVPMARVAPIQVTSWGAVETTGIAGIDYFISSEKQESKLSDLYYSEKLVRLKHIPALYEKPLIPSQPLHSRADFLWDDHDHIYLGVQQIFKYHPDMDAVFRAILEQDAKAKIVLVEHTTASLNQLLRARLDKALGGLAPRVVMMPPMTKESYYALLHHADVALDTLYYCGGQTSYDAFAAAVPVVTLPGDTMRSRSTAAMLAVMELEDHMQVVGLEDYARKAVELATDKDLNRTQRQGLKERSQWLFDTKTVIDEHAKCFHTMIEGQQ